MAILSCFLNCEGQYLKWTCFKNTCWPMNRSHGFALEVGGYCSCTMRPGVVIHIHRPCSLWIVVEMGDNNWLQDVSGVLTTSYVLKSRRVNKRPLLVDRNQRLRLAWCLARRGWHLRTWCNIHWSDESRFLLHVTDGRMRVWRHKDTAYTPMNIMRHGVVIHIHRPCS
jgi:hypothetical protein